MDAETKVQFLNELADELLSQGAKAEYEFDEDNDMVIKFVDGPTVFIGVQDGEFALIMLPSFWSIDSAVESNLALRAANVLNAQRKFMKLYTNSDITVMSAAIEVPACEHLINSVRVYVAILVDTAHTFAEMMRNSSAVLGVRL